MPSQPFAIALLLLCSLSAPISTADGPQKKHPADLQLDDCMRKNPSTQGMNECLTRACAQWDRELNRVYQELSSRLDEKSRIALRDSQRAWIAFRDREFTLLEKLYGAMDGTMYGTMLRADRVELIRKRSLELKSLIDVLDSR